METGFRFDEKTHKYFLDGVAMTGVTTVLGVINKPALLSWASKMATEYIREHVEYAIPGENGGFWAIKPSTVEEAKTAFAKKRDKAADLGTDVHALCEGFIKQAILENEGEMKYVYQSETLQVEHFIRWARKNNVKFLESEKVVYSKDLFVGGKYDFKCKIGDKVYLGDIKTTSGIYDKTPFAQCAAYQLLEAHCENKKVEDIAQGRVIVNIKKDGTFDEDKDTHYSYDYETDIGIFMSALTIYKTNK